MDGCEIPQFHGLVIRARHDPVIVEVQTSHAIRVPAKSEQSLARLKAPHLWQQAAITSIVIICKVKFYENVYKNFSSSSILQTLE